MSQLLSVYICSINGAEYLKQLHKK